MGDSKTFMIEREFQVIYLQF